MKTDVNEKDNVIIGRVGSPVGLKGEVRVNLYAEDSANLKEGKVLLLMHGENSLKAGEKTVKVESIRYQKAKPVVKLEGVDDRDAAEAICNMEVYVEASQLEELPDGEHYVRDLIGCRVLDTAEGKDAEIGVLKDVIQNTAQSILEVETAEGKTVLIPAVDAFMREIDEEARVIKVELIPGFVE